MSENNKGFVWSHVWSAVLGSVATIAALFLVYFWFPPNLIAKFSEHIFAISPKDIPLTFEEMILLSKMQSQNVLLFGESLLSQTVQFYDAVIVILTILLSVLSVVAFMYIKTSSRDHLEDLVEKVVTKEVTTLRHSARFENLLDEKIEFKLHDYLSALESVDKIQKRTDKISDRLEDLEESSSLPQDISIPPGDDHGKV